MAIETEQVVDYSPVAATAIGPTLILNLAGFLLYGYNVAQSQTYLRESWKKDRLLTKIWVALVCIFATAATLYEIKPLWQLSIDTWGPEGIFVNTAESASNTVVLDAVVLLLVQLFWNACIWRMYSDSKYRWVVVCPIALFSLLTFCAAISEAAIAKNADNPSYFPTGVPGAAVTNRLVFSAGIVADLAILSALVGNLMSMRRRATHMKRVITRLSWIFLAVTLVSTVVLIVGIVVSEVHWSGIRVSATITPIIPPIYTFGFFSILNARQQAFTDRLPSQPIKEASLPRDRDLENQRRAKRYGSEEPEMIFSFQEPVSTSSSNNGSGTESLPTVTTFGSYCDSRFSGTKPETSKDSYSLDAQERIYGANSFGGFGSNQLPEMHFKGRERLSC